MGRKADLGTIKPNGVLRNYITISIIYEFVVLL
jgi:hypothetical protein